MSDQERFWRRTVPHVFELATAGAYALIGLAYIIEPTLIERSPVGREVEPYDTVWSIGYMAAWPLVLLGILFPSERQFRVGGLIILLASLVMHGTAAVTFDAEPRAFVYFLFAGACAVRIAHLVRLHRAGLKD